MTGEFTGAEVDLIIDGLGILISHVPFPLVNGPTALLNTEDIGRLRARREQIIALQAKLLSLRDKQRVEAQTG